MRVGHLNVGSLTAHFDIVKRFIADVQLDVFVVTETWLNSAISSEIVSLQEFVFYRVDRMFFNGRGGGVGIFIRKSLHHRVIYRTTGVHIEQLWVTINVSKQKYVIAAIYRPQNSKVLNFLEELENSMSEVMPDGDVVTILGDMNINLLQDTPAANHYKNFLESYDLSQLIEEPTRITSRTQTLIDHVVTSDKAQVSDISVVHVDGISDNDHSATICSLGKLQVVRGVKHVTFRDFRNFDRNEFHRAFFSVNWSQMYQLDHVNDMVNFLNASLINCFEACAPLRTVRITKPHAPWLTGVIREMIKLRDKAYSKFRATRSGSHWEYYKMLRNYTKQAIRREKRAYLQCRLQNASSKVMWSALRELDIVSARNCVLPAHLENVDDINAHFTYVPQQHKSREQLSLLAKYKNDRFGDSIAFEFEAVEKSEVLKCLNSIKSNAVGSDLISLTMLQLVSDDLVDHITFIFNQCLAQSVFPDVWKTARVIPLAKVSNPQDFDELRPISLLPVLSKVLEKIMYGQLSKYLLDNNIIPSCQSGFREGHSTTTALTTIVDDLFRATDEGMVSCLVMLDYSKAFNTMDPRVLCDKLRYFGFSKSSIDLLRSYLTERFQAVTYNSQDSKPLPLFYGVPQGTILGPLMFSLYISDFHSVVKDCTVHHYADDTQIYLSFKPDQADVEDIINNDLESLVDISAAHNLKLNANKSYALFFGSRDRREIAQSTIAVSVNGERLPVRNEAKNLGLWMDCDLRFTKHVNQLCQSSYNTLRQLYPHRKVMSSNLKLQLCESLILSRLSYCDSVYGPALLANDSGRLQRVQNSYFRFSFGIRKFDRISYKIREMGRLRLESIRRLHLLTLTHKILLSRIPLYLFRKLVRIGDVSRFTTRNSGTLEIPKHRTSLFQRSFSYSACKSYNQLPVEFLNYSLLNFKKKLKVVLFS